MWKAHKLMTYAVVALGLVLSFPSHGYAQGGDAPEDDSRVLSSSDGRYVFGQVSNFRRDQFLLDTHSGRLWQMVEDDEERSKLQAVPFIQIFGEEAYLPDPELDVQKHRQLNRELRWQGQDPWTVIEELRRSESEEP